MLRRLFFQYMYYSQPPWDTGISPPELIAFIQENPPGKALDLGCGTGTNVVTLAKNGWQVTGVDYAPRAIRMGRKKIHKAGVQARLEVGDVTRLDNISGRFDLILDIGCLHSLNEKQRKQYLNNLDQLLSDNGYFLLYTFIEQPEQPGSGLPESSINDIQKIAALVERTDGTDRGARPSAWLKFQKKS